jgi:DNA-binding NarL/FixJ family response regulator
LKLLVVDDHPVMRDGLAALLTQLGPDTAVLEASDAAEALTLISGHDDFDAVILDLGLPGMDGLRALTEFGRERPELPIIVVSASEDARDVREALAKGALGYVPKSAGQRTLLSAIRLVLNGEIYVPPLILDEPPASSPPNVLPEAKAGRQPLTDRQIEVLRRLSEGQPNKLIARELGLSEKTVKAHVTAIFRALNVVNRTQAAAAGREAGLI